MVPRMMKPRLKMAMAAAEMLYSATQRGGHPRPRHLSGGPISRGRRSWPVVPPTRWGTVPHAQRPHCTPVKTAGPRGEVTPLKPRGASGGWPGCHHEY